MRTVIIIPARYSSSRFPGKPLAKILNKPMIQWVYETACRTDVVDETWVATDDSRIHECVKTFGGNVLMTATEHQCGTDRISEAANQLGLLDEDIILNIQGDEPLITAEMIETLKNSLTGYNVMGTLKKEITDKGEIDNPNIVKVITDKNDYAIYFSRYCIPYCRNKDIKIKFYKHIGAYAYTKKFLDTYCKLNKSILEKSESLEQLRAIENGYKIKVLETRVRTIGVDTEEQLIQAENYLRQRGN